ncbi:hypothetical protein [Longimycelium tulufanense]|nr:hypothetical protein [Longimycelium tulufanense]
MSCDLFANPPRMDGTVLIGEGGRVCEGPVPTSARITVRIRHHRRWWFDRTLAAEEVVSSGFITTLTPSYECRGISGKEVFTETRINTQGKKQKGRSRRVGVSCG